MPVDAAKRRSKAQKVESLVQLVHAIYDGRFKRVKVTKAESTAIQAGPKPTEEERANLFDLAESDRLLERTRSLMLLGVRSDNRDLSTFIREFSHGVLERHPLFQSASLSGVLSGTSKTLSEAQVFETIASSDCGQFDWRDGQSSLSKKQCTQCRRNAVCCLLIHFWSNRPSSLDSIISHLHTFLWAPESRRLKNDTEKLVAIIGTKDHLAASIICGLFEKKAAEDRWRVNSAIAGEQRALAQRDKLEQRISELELKLAGVESDNKHLRKKADDTSQLYETGMAHFRDDYEQLRGQVLRRLKDEVALLDEGLHALRRTPPKIHVMEDHAERAIDGLKVEIERLKRSS